MPSREMTTDEYRRRSKVLSVLNIGALGIPFSCVVRRALLHLLNCQYYLPAAAAEEHNIVKCAPDKKRAEGGEGGRGRGALRSLLQPFRRCFGGYNFVISRGPFCRRNGLFIRRKALQRPSTRVGATRGKGYLRPG